MYSVWWLIILTSSIAWINIWASKLLLDCGYTTVSLDIFCSCFNYLFYSVERMEGVEQNSYCISWGRLIHMFPPLWNIREKEVVLRLMRCFRSSGLYVSVDTVHLVAKEVALTTNESTVFRIAIFLIYQVSLFLSRACSAFDCSSVISYLKLKLFRLLSAAFVSPSRDALCLGERIMVYLPRCADTNPEVRKTSAQVGNWWYLMFFYIVHDLYPIYVKFTWVRFIGIFCQILLW